MVTIRARRQRIAELLCSEEATVLSDVVGKAVNLTTTQCLDAIKAAGLWQRYAHRLANQCRECERDEEVLVVFGDRDGFRWQVCHRCLAQALVRVLEPLPMAPPALCDACDHARFTHLTIDSAGGVGWLWCQACGARCDIRADGTIGEWRVPSRVGG